MNAKSKKLLDENYLMVKEHLIKQIKTEAVRKAEIKDGVVLFNYGTLDAPNGSHFIEINNDYQPSNL
ncbi:MAG: hypothetical protein D6732_24490 [Methanobacteriota archaeon]|nr:MAG: hypothetical protein D6732_24490 [Euryarchaeota archaeon]